MKSWNLILMLFVFLFLIGCITEPKKKDYTGRPNACYDAAYCKYLAAASKTPADKSDCNDSAKECRALERYINCKDDKFRSPEHKFQECWDKLNSK